MGLIETSAQAASENNMKIALERAREASSRERALIRLQEQAGLSDNHNIDLTFAVSSLNYYILLYCDSLSSVVGFSCNFSLIFVLTDCPFLMLINKLSDMRE